MPAAICGATLIELLTEKIDVPADQIVHRWGGAAICNQARFDASLRIKEQACHVRRRADPTVRLLHAIAVLLQVVHKLPQIVGPGNPCARRSQRAIAQ